MFVVGGALTNSAQPNGKQTVRNIVSRCSLSLSFSLSLSLYLSFGAPGIAYQVERLFVYELFIYINQSTTYTYQQAVSIQPSTAYTVLTFSVF